MQLRYYQQEAVNAVYDYLRNNSDNPCIVLPTGAGKTPVMSTICDDAVNLWGGRVLVLAHVKELLEQTAATLAAITDNIEIGVYSAGLKSKDMHQSVIVAGIQSVYKKAFDFDPFDLILVDECHLISPSGEGMYRTFLNEAKVVNPKLRVIGLTATPYRMGSGMVCAPENILNNVCYEIGVKELIVKGFLCPLKSKAGIKKPNTDNLHIRAGEFISSEVEQLMDDDSLVSSACNEIIDKSKDRNSILIFTSSVAHAEHVAETLAKRVGDINVGIVTGKTAPGVRSELLCRFKGNEVKADLFGATKPPLKYLVNVNVLTTGFDATNIDCVVLLRPTASPGLYYQMVGRGFRLHELKTDCLVLDFGSNITRHGPVDAMVIKDKKKGRGFEGCPAKECPKCHAVINSAYSVCPECGHEFAKSEKEGDPNHDGTASDEQILSGVIEDNDYEVKSVQYYQHFKKNAHEGAPTTMRVTYEVGFNNYHNEWVCLEHTGFARNKAVKWWKERSNAPVPDTIEEALEWAEAGYIAKTEKITVRSISGERFDRITDYVLGETPGHINEEEVSQHGGDFAWPEGWGDDDDIPF